MDPGFKMDRNTVPVRRQKIAPFRFPKNYLYTDIYNMYTYLYKRFGLENFQL